MEFNEIYHFLRKNRLFYLHSKLKKMKLSKQIFFHFKIQIAFTNLFLFFIKWSFFSVVNSVCDGMHEISEFSGHESTLKKAQYLVCLECML